MNGVVPYSSGMTSETLSTLLCEVAAQVNNRPLTKDSEDPNDAAALTSSHLLLHRTRWRQVQYLADLFWRRCIREYMPQLHVRTRWLLSLEM